jgi:hypothetical protein
MSLPGLKLVDAVIVFPLEVGAKVRVAPPAGLYSGESPTAQEPASGAFMVPHVSRFLAVWTCAARHWQRTDDGKRGYAAKPLALDRKL